MVAAEKERTQSKGKVYYSDSSPRQYRPQQHGKQQMTSKQTTQQGKQGSKQQQMGQQGRQGGKQQSLQEGKQGGKQQSLQEDRATQQAQGVTVVQQKPASGGRGGAIGGRSRQRLPHKQYHQQKYDDQLDA